MRAAPQRANLVRRRARLLREKATDDGLDILLVG
jgi:hypothetical protein